ncbi:MAG: hypothetical protein KDM63_06460, partial [Verrucomicrobiae bacterium]|nr:hypothetical protein [Verrucomicrobiae bacterium]
GKSNDGLMITLSNIRATGGGYLLAEGTGGRGNGKNLGTGIYSTTMISGNALTSITGTASSLTTGLGNIGVDIQKNSKIEGATLSLVGTGGRGTSRNVGVWVIGGSLKATAGTAAITGNALSSTTGYNNIGVIIDNRVTVSGTGGIDILGTGGGGTKFNHGVMMQRSITATGANVVGAKGSGSTSKDTFGDFFTI